MKTGAGDRSLEVKMKVRQGLVRSPLLPCIVMDVVTKEARSGLSWELLYADDLALMVTTVWGRVKEKVGGVESKFVGQRIEGDCREDKSDGQWRWWRSSIKPWCMAMWSMQQLCSR